MGRAPLALLLVLLLVLAVALTWELHFRGTVSAWLALGAVLVVMPALAVARLTGRWWPRSEPEDPQLLLRTLCHELRTPLSALEGLASALARPDLDCRAEVAELARHQARHAQLVLGWVGDLCDPPAPRETPALRPLGDVVAAAADAAGVGAGRLQVELSASARSAHVDCHLVQRVLTNLLENAVLHGPAGPVRVGAAHDRESLRLRVSDEGGSQAGLRWALARDRPPQDSVGLGLWAVRQLVTRAGGDIFLAPSSGTTVEVCLPGRPSERPCGTTVPRPRSLHRPSARRGHRLAPGGHPRG